jgi:hypothetical protein
LLITDLRKKWLLPIIFFQLYLALTIFFFFFGPWPWNIDNSMDLLIFLVAVQVSIFIGYSVAWPQILKTNSSLALNCTILDVGTGLNFLRQALYIAWVLFIPTSLSRTGQFIPDVMAGIINTGAVYNENYQRLAEGNLYLIVEYVRMLFSPWLIALFPLTVVYWAKLSNSMRFGCSAVILANLSLYIATGTNKGLADFIVTGPWLIYLGVAAGISRLRITRGKILIIFTLMFYGFLQFFGSSQLKREGNVGEFGVFNTGAGLIYADSGILNALLNEDFRVIYESLTRYIVQGYYALSLSMKVDHASTLGFGHSMFMARNADAIFDTDYFTLGSLPGIIESQFGWSMLGLWHSIYPWLASDFGFVGSIIVMGLFSYLFSLSWGLSLCTLNYRWIIILFLMLILFFYIPANNQIFQSGETCIGFFLILSGIFINKIKKLIFVGFVR